MRHGVVEEFLCFEGKVAFFTRMKELLVFEEGVLIFSPFVSCEVFKLTSDEASM